MINSASELSVYYETLPLENTEGYIKESIGSHHVDIGSDTLSFSTKTDAENAVKLADKWAMQTTIDIREAISSTLNKF